MFGGVLPLLTLDHYANVSPFHQLGDTRCPQLASEKPRSGIRSEEEWRRLVSEYEASDMTMTQFSAERGLARSSLTEWRKRFRDKLPTDVDGRSGGQSGPLNELSGLFDHTDAPQPAGHWRVELDLGGGTVLRLR